ncbi:hypothetical protein [Xanthomonas bonasiae]|uniref:hypothetical protein n=1 Tax=Xanthomonas bonasiae TaxID=2810351 RepID=UPI001980D6C3|nr:hypothetical protein [Xanthomonas bonasiae]MBN6112645.1 hypothetical protein [Xanthomonas bonasiae]
MKTVFLMCVVAITSGCHGAGPAQGKDGQDRDRVIRLSGSDCPQGVGPTQIVRLEALVANARAYEGRRVSVTGYYNQGFEHSALYASPGRDPFARTSAEGIWINGISPFSGGNGQHIGVTGSFSEATKGHLSQWSGSICVTTVALLEREAP